ncbi:osmoprotectant NAGGN system M42 family peptidase [Desulfonatronum parangueonense]
MENITLDMEYLRKILLQLLEIPSPTGYTDRIVHFAGEELERLGIPFELTRRGAIRADIKGRTSNPDRALVTHLDTIGAMVRELKPNGRLGITSIGTWSSRFAEGARVTIFTDTESLRGTILPLKASGHVYGDEIDTQPVNWDNIEVRIDEPSLCIDDLLELGIHVGDWVAVDPLCEIRPSGYINSRHLDNKAGVAILFTAAKAILESGAKPPLDCHLLFTIAEEVGTGASVTLHGDVAEMVSIDTAPLHGGHNLCERGVSVAMMDSSGPFDYHLTHRLLELCRRHDILHRRDVFRYYRSDSASAVEAGNDLRTALVCFGVDGTHGYERTHFDSLQATAELIAAYMLSEPVVWRDRFNLGPLKGFPVQPE